MPLFFLLTCKNASSDRQIPLSYQVLEGETMGTYYRFTYYDEQKRDFQAELDQLLKEVNQEVSTYIKSSTISRFNQAETELVLGLDETHFITNLEVAKSVYGKTNGAFDPTIMPLVNYWGFGYSEKKRVSTVDSLVVDSLMNFVGLDKVNYERTPQVKLQKVRPGVQLDFSGCAKGYGVDAIGFFLEAKGIHNYLVDIGGEIRARGENPKGNIWNIGINVPREGAAFDEIQTAAPVKNRSVATSGNYRNYYEVEGTKYSHTISPYHGFPERNTLLSASVFAENCVMADAYATAFMVLGIEKAFPLAQQLPDIEAYFITGNPDGTMSVSYTDGLKSIFD